MSLFIHPENQKILWNVISASSQFQLIPQKETWFKDIIQDFYNKTSHIQITPEALQILNKETIIYMLDRIGGPSKSPGPSSGPNNPPYQYHPPAQQQQPVQQYQQPVQQYQQPSQQQQFQQYVNNNSNPNITYQLDSTQTQTNVSRDYLSGQKQDMLSQQFNHKQKEYESMRSRESPKDVNFRDAPLDTPMTNIDELVKNHLREREAELQKFAPQSPSYMVQQAQSMQSGQMNPYKLVPPPIQQQQNSNTRQTPTPTLKIDQTSIEPPIIENIVEFANMDKPNEIQSNKKVHWTPSPSTELSLAQFKEEIDILRNEMREEVKNEIRAEFAMMREMIGTLQAPLLIASQQLHEFRNQIVQEHSQNTIVPLHQDQALAQPK